jgi:hypothetical protein
MEEADHEKSKTKLKTLRGIGYVKLPLKYFSNASFFELLTGGNQDGISNHFANSMH